MLVCLKPCDIQKARRRRIFFWNLTSTFWNLTLPFFSGCSLFLRSRRTRNRKSIAAGLIEQKKTLRWIVITETFRTIHWNFPSHKLLLSYNIRTIYSLLLIRSHWMVHFGQYFNFMVDFWKNIELWKQFLFSNLSLCCASVFGEFSTNICHFVCFMK